MSDVGGTRTKTSQVGRLKTVRSAAVKAFKNIIDEDERIKRLLFQLGKARHGGHNKVEVEDRLHTDMEIDHSPNQKGGKIHYNSRSLVKQTLSKYGNGSSNVNDQNIIPMPTRKGQDGKDYPYGPIDPEYLSKFVVGFRVALNTEQPTIGTGLNVQLDRRRIGR